MLAIARLLGAQLVLALLIVTAAQRTNAALIVIDFESHDAMTYLTGNPIPESARLYPTTCSPASE